MSIALRLRRRTALLMAIALSLSALPAQLPAAGAGDIRVTDAWARAMPPVTRTTAGYLVLHNPGNRDDVLLGARIEGVRVVEIHEMVRNGELMKMQRRESLVVPAGGSASLAPGGLHLMLIDAQKPLVDGSELRGVLQLRDAGEVPVTISVRVP